MSPEGMYFTNYSQLHEDTGEKSVLRVFPLKLLLSRIKSDGRMKNGRKLFLNDISEFLGSREDRYFSNGYKGIDIIYKDTVVSQSCYTGSVAVRFGTWSKKNGTHPVAHLGTVEYISIAATVCRELMEENMHLDDETVRHSWISHFNCRIKPCDEINYNRIPLSGKIVSKKNKPGHTVYEFEVRIETVSVKLEISCLSENGEENLRNPKRMNRRKDIAETDMYKNRYKQRDVTITDVFIDGESMKSGGKATLCEDSGYKTGIGAFYRGLLLTDFILIAGQLTQALLCHMNGLSRSESSNLWLREMDAWCAPPINENICDSEVCFLDFRTLQKKEETWQSVRLSGRAGNIHSTIKVAQQCI
jgi:hypothetical protein